MQKVTGLGGVFLKAKDPKTMAAWYQKHLGIDFNDNLYFDFRWGEKGNTVFSFFKQDTSYFQPSGSPFMINFRVKDLHGLIAVLSNEGVQVVGNVEEYEYGKFGWVIDPEGNKIELWEPVDEK